MSEIDPRFRVGISPRTHSRFKGLPVNYHRIALASLGATVAYFVYGFATFVPVCALNLTQPHFLSLLTGRN